MSDVKLARIAYQLAKMAVGLLEKEYGFGKRVTDIRIVGPEPSKNVRIFVVDNVKET